MIQSARSQDIDLRYLVDNFSLVFIDDARFFAEWQQDLPDISDLQKQQLDRVRLGYLNLLNYPPMLEDVVRMAILDPLLFIGEFYLSPFYVKSEVSVEIVTEDEEKLVKGRLDTLVLKDRLWVMAIESKQVLYSVEAGLAQIVSYMLGNPQRDRPSYGLITSGGSFMFVKFLKDAFPQYATSKVFATRNLGDLYDVLRIFKRLTSIAIANG